MRIVKTLQITQNSAETLVTEFFRQSAGKWLSERRYYTLPDGETKEMVSLITVDFLVAGCEELLSLASLHQLSNINCLVCGAKVTWDSNDTVTGKQNSQGATLFGAMGNVLYRDRGFMTTKPVTANYYFINPETFCLKTEYKGSSFEEEIKLIGEKYRTRQTIISRAGEQVMIGQYLEKRMT